MEFKYSTFSDAYQPSLQLPDQPIFRSLGVPAQEFAPLSTLKVADISYPQDAFQYGEYTSKPLKKAGLDCGPSGPQPRPLKEVPCHLDKTHFCTTQSCNLVFSSLSNILTKLHVDFEVQHSKNKIRGVCHPENIPCSFVVNVFQGKENFVVEFQRRSGCVVQFSNFYNEVLTSFMNTDTQPAVRKAEKQESNLDEPTLKNLVRMACSELVDVQREGLRVLTNCLTTSESNKKLFLQSSASFLPSLLSSSDEQVLRLASVLVDALSSDSSQTTIKIAESSFSLLAKGRFSSLLGRDTKRHLTHALAGYTQTHSKHFSQHPKNQEFVACLERCSSLDNSTRNSVASALNNLVVF